MNPKKYVKKPVVIEAVQWTGNNIKEIKSFCDATAEFDGAWLFIHTLEGKMLAHPGDWIIKGIQGEFYPCKSDIFNTTYEPMEDAIPVDCEPVPEGKDEIKSLAHICSKKSHHYMTPEEAEAMPFPPPDDEHCYIWHSAYVMVSERHDKGDLAQMVYALMCKWEAQLAKAKRSAQILANAVEARMDDDQDCPLGNLDLTEQQEKEWDCVNCDGDIAKCWLKYAYRTAAAQPTGNPLQLKSEG